MMNTNQPRLHPAIEGGKVLTILHTVTDWQFIQPAMQQQLPELSCVRATSGSQALTFLTNWQSQPWGLPQLILLDVHLLCDATSWQLLEKLKAMPLAIRRIPVLLMGPSSGSGDGLKAYNSGASGYFQKPIDSVGWHLYCQDLRIHWTAITHLPSWKGK